MQPKQVKQFLATFAEKKDRTIVIIDFSNVERWKDSLGWTIDVHKLADLIKNFSYGKQFLRRFYYGSDYGPKENSKEILPWSNTMLTKAGMYRFEVVTKRVKYMTSNTNPTGYDTKCDFDVEMALDLIKERENYDTIVLFSGDGDLACVLDYLCNEYQKEAYVFGVRGHVGREIIDAQRDKIVKQILFAEDFENRLKHADLPIEIIR